MKGKPDLFISYRRQDSATTVGRLKEHLNKYFASDQIFLDVDSLQAGELWRDRLDEALEACSIVLAVIGTHWLQTSKDDVKPSIFDAKDMVRYELYTAHNLHKEVIPVIVDGAIMPDKGALPDELQFLPDRNGHELNYRTFGFQVDQLVEHIIQLGVEPKKATPARLPDPYRETLDEHKRSNLNSRLSTVLVLHLLFHGYMWCQSANDFPLPQLLCSLALLTVPTLLLFFEARGQNDSAIQRAAGVLFVSYLGLCTVPTILGLALSWIDFGGTPLVIVPIALRFLWLIAAIVVGVKTLRRLQQSRSRA